MDGLKLLLVLAAIVIALRRHVPVGLTLFGAGLLTALLYSVPAGDVLNGYWEMVRSQRFLSLTAVIVLITSLGALLAELGSLEKLAEACRYLPGGTRTATVAMPFLIGLMPMPGGALLSAPLVGKVLDDERYSPAFRTTVNYWFRHTIEFFWPVYPGIILTEAVTHLPIDKVMLLQLPMTLFMMLLGGLFFLRKIPAQDTSEVDWKRSLRGIGQSVWPIMTAIVIFGAFDIELSLAVLVGILMLIVVSRPGWARVKIALMKGFSWKLVLMVFGILSFQSVLELSNAVSGIQRMAGTYGLPPALMIVVICGTIGLLTGMVAAYVGMGYPLVAAFVYQPEPVPGMILLAYLSGYIGMLLSPTHLCLILTTGYFKADLGQVYRKLAVPLILLSLGGLALALSRWGSVFVSR